MFQDFGIDKNLSERINMDIDMLTPVGSGVSQNISAHLGLSLNALSPRVYCVCIHILTCNVSSVLFVKAVISKLSNKICS